MPLRLLPATLSVSEAICCTIVLFGTLPNCTELSRSSEDLLDFFLAFFLPTFFGIMSENTSEVSHAGISYRNNANNKDYEECKGVRSGRRNWAVRHVVYFVVMHQIYSRSSSLSIFFVLNFGKPEIDGRLSGHFSAILCHLADKNHSGLPNWIFSCKVSSLTEKVRESKLGSNS